MYGVQFNRSVFSIYLILSHSITCSCPEESKGKQCTLRHLSILHPERIALRYLHGKLSEEEIKAWHLSPCSDNEVNPFSNPKEKLCYDFQNHGYCKRNQEGKICRFRHLLHSHKDAIQDRKQFVTKKKKEVL